MNNKYMRTGLCFFIYLRRMKSILMKTFLFTRFFSALTSLFITASSFAQKDTTFHILAGSRISLLNTFSPDEFTSGYEKTSVKLFSIHIETGIIKASKANSKIYNGFMLKYMFTSKEALSRTYEGTIGDFGRHTTTTFWDNLGLRTVSLGYFFYYTFSEKSLSGFYINPDLVAGIMKQTSKREFILSMPSSTAIGYNLSAGFLFNFAKNASLRFDAGYRSISINPSEPGIISGTVNWSGFQISAGLTLIL